MLAASTGLPVESTPFAGGVLAFAQHMNGQHAEAERTARSAIEAGFEDPWTLHAIAHALYSQGRMDECIKFLDDHRFHVQMCNPSAFMKGHLEFHQALCYISTGDANKLETLIQGPLWKGLSPFERNDYWNATGLLNIHWKAELKGLRLDLSTVEEALCVLEATANYAKSSVFSLCILRWAKGSFRARWKKDLIAGDGNVLVVLAQAVDLLYPEGAPTMRTERCPGAWKLVSPVFQELESLGASPEQREVLDDFMVKIRQGCNIGFQ